MLVGSGASGSAKPGLVPALLKAPGGGSAGHGLPVPSLPGRAPIAMVTATLPGGTGAEPPQSEPVHLQSADKVVGAQVRPGRGREAGVREGRARAEGKEAGSDGSRAGAGRC